MFVDVDRPKVWTNANGVSLSVSRPCFLAKSALNFSGADLPLWSLKLGWQRRPLCGGNGDATPEECTSSFFKNLLYFSKAFHRRYAPDYQERIWPRKTTSISFLSKTNKYLGRASSARGLRLCPRQLSNQSLRFLRKQQPQPHMTGTCP